MKCLLLLFSCQALSNSLPPHGLQLASPLSTGLPRQEHWSGLPFSSPEDLPDLGIKPTPSTSVGGFFKTEPPGKPINCLERHWGEKFMERWECQTTFPASWEICMQIKKQQLEPDTEQQLVWPPWTLDGKESACNVGDLGLIPRSGRSSGEENDNLPQYSCLENPMERGAWWTTVHGVAKSQSVMSNWHYYCYIKAVYCHPV